MNELIACSPMQCYRNVACSCYYHHCFCCCCCCIQ